MPKSNHRGTVMGLAAVIALLFSITVAPTALADSEKQNFDMLVDFATEQTGASGSGVARTHKDSVRIEVRAKGLLPHHQYEMKVTIVDCPPFPMNASFCDSPVVDDPLVVSCGPETSNSSGNARFRCAIDLVQLFGAGTYRTDFFVTHIHPTGPGVGPPLSGVLDRDPLLRCFPASTHMVPE